MCEGWRNLKQLACQPRQCGDCCACCVFLRVDTPGFTKKPMQPCDHLVHADIKRFTGVCGIYNDRFQICHDYQCLWRMGYGAEQDRPNLCGVLIDNIRPIANAIVAKALWDDAEASTEAIGAVLRISRATDKVCLVTDYPERRIIRAEGRPL